MQPQGNATSSQVLVDFLSRLSSSSCKSVHPLDSHTVMDSKLKECWRQLNRQPRKPLPCALRTPKSVLKLAWRNDIALPVSLLLFFILDLVGLYIEYVSVVAL
jgi:hypothetical protein